MESDFMVADKNRDYRDSVKKAMEWLDIVIDDIDSRYGLP